MGKKDVETVKYTSRNDVVADIINCAFCNGEHIVDERDISEYDGRENILIPYINDSDFKHIQKFRDVLKKVHLKGLDFVADIVIGIEDQSNIHYAIPVKNNLYDAINYASQVEHIAKIHRKNKDITGDELLDSARSDFGRLMKLLKQQALHKNFEDAISKQEPYLLSKEAVAIIKSFTGFETGKKSENEEVIDMSQEILEMEARFEAKGVAKQLIALVCRKLQKGKPIDIIADELEEELDYIEQICRIAERFAPEYDVEKIYKELKGVNVV